MSTFGERLKDAIILRGMTRGEVAAHCMVCAETLDHWLSLAVPDMSAMNFLALAEYLRVRTRWLGLGRGDIMALNSGESTTLMPPC